MTTVLLSKLSVLRKVAPLEWLCLVGGTFLVIHYSWLMDDAFVYFRYVDNLLYLGYGLVYNAGEYVEGFSSPLWTIVLILCRTIGLNYWVIVRLIGIICFLVFWALLVALNRRMSPKYGAIVNLPLLLLAFNYGVECYFTSGLETPLVQVASVLYALFVLDTRRLSLQVLLAMSVILRHELAVPFAMCLAWAWFREKRFPLRMLLLGVSITASWECFRIYYYADLFPNTYYLKNTSDFAQGFHYLQDTAKTYWLYPLIFVILVLTVIRLIRQPKPALLDEQQPQPAAPKKGKGRRRKKNDQPIVQQSSFHTPDVDTSAPPLDFPARLMMIALSFSVAIYVIKIGGDARHYRYLAFSYCLLICSFSGIVEHVWICFSPRGSVWVSVPIGLLVVAWMVSLYPPQLSIHPFVGMPIKCDTFEEFHQRKTKFHKTTNKINDAWVHRHDPSLAQPRWGLGKDIEYKQAYKAFLQGNHDYPYSQVGTSAWCSSIYRAFRVRIVHSLGLTDLLLAHTDVKTDRPAHKEGLIPLAEDLRKIIVSQKSAPHLGMYREAVDQGKAPEWIRENLDTIEVLERKMFNTHHFFENLRLAFAFPPKIHIKPSSRSDRHRS